MSLTLNQALAKKCYCELPFSQKVCIHYSSSEGTLVRRTILFACEFFLILGELIVRKPMQLMLKTDRIQKQPASCLKKVLIFSGVGLGITALMSFVIIYRLKSLPLPKAPTTCKAFSSAREYWISSFVFAKQCPSLQECKNFQQDSLSLLEQANLKKLFGEGRNLNPSETRHLYKHLLSMLPQGPFSTSTCIETALAHSQARTNARIYTRTRGSLLSQWWVQIRDFCKYGHFNGPTTKEILKKYQELPLEKQCEAIAKSAARSNSFWTWISGHLPF